ncbi:hypothetical protein IKF28_01250 [Candidatus Saccharibacteria bacterium]|nr:hypothetical protein [Candidatus Saccharibacteria bacterium]
MRHKVLLSSAASAALLGATMFPASVFADDNYGIVYSGGKPLAENNGTININSQLINELSSLVSGSDGKVELTSKNWLQGWHHRQGEDEECHSVSYFTINGTSSSDKHSFAIKNNNYQIDVDINGVSIIDPPTGTGAKPIAVGIDGGNGFLYGSNIIYDTQEKCQGAQDADKKTGSLTRKSATNRQFIETNIKLKKIGASSAYLAGDDNIYFGLTDVDASQSFKILNSGNELSQNNMFAKDAKLLQQDFYYDRADTDGDGKKESTPKENPGTLPATCTEITAQSPISDSNPSAPFLNCFKDGYIYSQYNIKTRSSDINADLAGSDILVSLKDKTQTDGLNLVFGFTDAAGSSVEYYAKQYKVTYASDKNGEIAEDARTSESLIAGDTASGSKTDPKEGYEFKYWTANVDVTLTNGKTIKAGEPITDEELKQVVVDKDITFTAIHTKEGEEPEEEDEEGEEDSGTIATPDTGASTKDINAVLIPASLITILLAALTIRALPRLAHKKVGFDK